MKSKAKAIINRLLIAATVSLVNNNDAKANTIFDVDDPDMGSLSRIKALKNIIKTQIFKLNKLGKVKFVNAHTSHGSHSSHSSHSSHASHYSSTIGNNGNGSSSSQNYSSRDTYSIGTTGDSDKKSQFAPTPTSKELSMFKIGDRIMQKGVYGNDVKELSDYLILINLLKKDQITLKNNFVIFNENIEIAVKKFQLELGLQDNGIIDKELAELIKGKIEELNNNSTNDY